VCNSLRPKGFLVPTIHFSRLNSIAADILQGAGATPPHAHLVADHLVGSNLVGHDSHGVLRLSQYCDAIESGELDPRARPLLMRESVAGAVLDGQQAFGQVAAHHAMSMAVDRAGSVGVSAITLHNCYHSGRLAVYALMAARSGMIGLVMVNAGGGGQSVTPFGGMERRLATNPFSIAVPLSGDFQPVLDVATSMAPEGKIRDYCRRGEALPPGWIIDADGQPASNAQQFYGPPAGAILPWGGPVGYKGFGLAFLIDVIAGALSGAGCCGPESVPARDGVLFLAIDVEQFVARAQFDGQVRRLIDHVKSCRPAPGFDEVFVPGELEHREQAKRRRIGILVDDTTWNEINVLADRYGVTGSLNGDGVAKNGHELADGQATPVSSDALLP
jgi:uncharacterized oxidoreductase